MKPGTVAVLLGIGIAALARDPSAARDRPASPARLPLLRAQARAAPSDAPLVPVYAAIDSHSATGTSSNVNGILEPGESVQVNPYWTNVTGLPQSFTGTASNLTGPPGPTYTIDDVSASYGTVAAGATTNCDDGTGDCYVITVAGARPVLHWDVTLNEALSVGSVSTVWTIHVGASFADVATTDQFYPYIEELLHMNVTTGCGGNDYCPTSPVTRAQMAVFLLKSEHGSAYVPPTCTGIFEDVPCPSQFADWIEQLYNENITGGCQSSPLLYCPDNPVTRAQMAPFILKTEHGSAYVPPTCTGIFGDVPCPSLFANWVEQLYNEGITGGCQASPLLYCPDNPVTRGQMAVFLVKAFAPPMPPLPTPTATTTPTVTLTNTSTPDPTPTLTPTWTLTGSMPPTSTRTPTFTLTPSITNTATNTPTVTPTNTFTSSRTFTNTRTFTSTQTPTNTATPSPTPHNVQISNYQFLDTASGTQTTTIAVGDTVQWIWLQGQHSTTSGTCTSGFCTPDFNWDSQIQTAPHTFTRQFNTVGTFPYYCQLHGGSMGMVGVINVLPLTPTPSRPTRR